MQRIRADVALVGHVEAEERFAAFPPDFTVKGMFFSRMVQLGGASALADVQPKLLKPPALGRYLPFSDYPQVDFSRLAHRVATGLFLRRGVCEAMRLLARKDLETFANSGVGSVMMALAGRDTCDALMKLPDMYRATLNGGTVKAVRESNNIVLLQYDDFYGWLDCYPLGHVEGLAAHLGQLCEIEVDQRSLTSALMRVTVT
jgi:uncharacterized protein (TIGR02265 family)